MEKKEIKKRCWYFIVWNSKKNINQSFVKWNKIKENIDTKNMVNSQ